ncbi:MAG: hypothetical protein H6Q70_514 [Firmicutes bacterium]|nr:hypothetical protein [Bacillota bacterium]
MDITFNTPTTASFLKAADITPRTFEKNMRLGMKESTRSVKDLAVMRHKFISRTGALIRSITDETIFSDESKVEGRVYIDEKIAPYGKWVHEGTRPHDIVPTKKQCLRWAWFVGTGGGEVTPNMYRNLRTTGFTSNSAEFVFAKKVHHPGTKADMFIREAGMLKREYINEVFANYSMRATKEAGL